MNNLYEALETCLQDIEQGADVESVLFHYPDLADELRPMLEASAGAKSMAVPVPSAEVTRRNRAKVLQRAAEMREGRSKSSQRIWFASLRRIAVTLVVVIVLFVSGTSLVGASSNTLPGDNLYPVKRTWEGLRLFFTFNMPEREALELEHENERLHEVTELLADGRSEEVDFNGRVASQSRNEWVVADVRVLTSGQTEIDRGIVVGSPVRVRGITQTDGTVLAERIRLLSSDEKLPETEDDHESEEANNNNNSKPGSGPEQPEQTETPEPENENQNENSGSNENQNENANENSNSNENSGNDNESNENSGNENNEDSGNENENHNESNENNENEKSGNENGNENGGEEEGHNENENSGSGNEGGGEKD